MQTFFRLTGFVMILLLLLTAPALAEKDAAAPIELPELTKEGFLPSMEDEPFIVIDDQAGRWIYIDDELNVQITRHENDPGEAKKLIWYETEIRCTPDDPLRSILKIKEGKLPGHALVKPTDFLQNYQPILCFNDDYFSSRWYNKQKQGIIIRNGQVLSETPWPNDVDRFPPLEIMALFSDGSLKTYKGSEHTAEEYLAMGVTDTFAFGPILVQDGKPGARMADTSYSHYREPRCALGMIEPYHYIVLITEGRISRSAGVYLDWLSEKMIELGAVEAINLDGGGTTYIAFMGKQLNKSKSKPRSMGSMLAVGVEKWQPEEKDGKK